MQVFWVSGPVGHIRSFNLSYKTVVVGVVLLVLGLLAAGSTLQFFGFRLALEYDPQIARRLGNLHTALELESLNAVYHARLNDLDAEHRKLSEQVAKLHAANLKLKEMLPATVTRDLPRGLAQGGMFLPSTGASPAEAGSGSVLGRMNLLIKTHHAHTLALTEQVKGWQAAITWLDSLPVGLPVGPGRVAVSSGFGERSDPLTQRPALHTGIDFELPQGTPILAAGAGVVVEAGWDAQYGQTLVLKHPDGYSSRYAHASRLMVDKGATVTKAQVVALSGNTGRSTGPHLHFEVLRNGKPVDPAQYLLPLAARR